ncbi:MAG TPA: RHS repeat-associated core domain-containing protein [Methylomirabilota bacterium]|nr:RHS repeat-associated core domain-containing protein [Methylomirabilota bacterium]
MTPRALAVLVALAVAGWTPARAETTGRPPVVLVADGLGHPRGVAIDTDGRAIVADHGGGIVVRVNADGSRTTLARDLRKPVGVAIDGAGRILVVEDDAGRIVRLDPTGPTVIVDGLLEPGWLAVADDGTIYVGARDLADPGARSGHDAGIILAVRSDGRRAIVASGLDNLGGLAVDGQAVYAVARMRASTYAVRRVPLARASAASWLAPLAGLSRAIGLARDRLGALWIAGSDAAPSDPQLSGAVVKLDARGALAPLLHGLEEPQGLALGPDGDLWITDAPHGRLLRVRAPAPPVLLDVPAATAHTGLPLHGRADAGARIDVFVNDATTSATTDAGADGAFNVIVVVAPNGDSVVEALATADGGRGLTSAPTVVSVEHDADEPQVAFTRPAPGAFVRRRVDVAARAQDSASGVAEVVLEAGGTRLSPTQTPAPPAPLVDAVAPWDTAFAADGAVTLSARATDAAGNTASANRLVIVDNTAPTVWIVEGPEGDVAAAAVRFVFAAADNVSPATAIEFAWRVDAAPFSEWAAGQVATPGALAAGAHTFEVRARDQAGNESAAAARAFRVTAAPTIIGVTPAAGPPGTSVTITGTGFAPGPVSVSFASVPAAIRSASPAALVTVVPPAARSGALVVTTPQGAATAAFVVDAPDLALRAAPARARTVPGLPVAFTLTLDDSGAVPFTGVASLAVDAPPGATVTVTPPAMAAGQRATLTVTPEQPGVVTLVARITAATAAGALERAVSVSVDTLAAARAIGGQVTFVDGEPLAGVRLSLAGAVASTDDGGNFVFVDPPPGGQMLGVDANAARAGLPIYAVTVDVAERPSRLPPLRITPPPPAERFVAIANATSDQVITDERLPGFSLTLPAGVTITGWDGHAKQRIAVERLRPDLLPVPPPPFPTRSLYQVFFGTPMGGLPSQPLPVTLPNDQDADPGERVELWYYDAAPLPGVVAGWRLAGTATVSADGTRAVADPGVGLARFCGVCGLACIKRRVAQQANRDPKGARAGDPVDLGTGQATLEKTDLALAGRLPLFVHRVHTPLDPFDRVAGFELATGPGWMLSVDIVLLDESADVRRLILPGNARVAFLRQPDGTFVNATLPDLAGAVLVSEAGGAHRVRFRDGSSWRFAAGWVPRGKTLPITGLGLLVEQRDRHGQALTIARDTAGAIASVSDAVGRTLTLHTTLLDPSDLTSARLTTASDPLGRVVRYGYDGGHRLVTVTDLAGGLTRYTYDVAGRLATVTDPRGLTFVTNEYDEQGRVVQQRQADGGVWTFAYRGPVGAHTGATVVDLRGATTTYALDGGRAVAVADALGGTTQVARDLGGRVEEVTDAGGRRVRFTYDGAGNPTRAEDPLGGVRTMTFDAIGHLTSLTDALGQLVRLEYDAAGNLASAADPTGAVTRFTADALGQITTVTDPAGATTRLEYGPHGEITALVDPLGARTAFEYDAASRLVRRTDPLGRTTVLVYDALDRPIQVIDAAGATRYDYDPNGNLLGVVDPSGRTRQYTYDAMDRRITATDGTGAVETWTYALDGTVRHVDRKGQLSVHEHDGLGRLARSRFADGSATTFDYDAAGRLARAASTDGATILWEYDALDRLVAETTVLGTTRYAWDPLGRRTAMTPADGVPITYAYDAAARLTGVARGGQVVAIQYDGAGRRRRLSAPAGVDVEYAHDAAGRLTTAAFRQASRPLGELVYGYTADGARQTATGTLARVALPGPVAVAEYDAANRQRRFGDRVMAYDANGNLTALTAPDRALGFAWDAQDRLGVVTGGAGALGFTYDPIGRRIARSVDGVETLFAYDGVDVVEERTATSAVTYLRSLVADELFAAGPLTLLTDGAGTVLATVDADGVTHETLVYEPFGRTLASGDAATRYGFTGREREPDDLYYHRARFYHAGLGRFISEDPIGLAGGLNAYTYAFDDPVNATDPTGLRTFVMHGIWSDPDDYAPFLRDLRDADPKTHFLSWNGKLRSLVPSTDAMAEQLLKTILKQLQDDPLSAGEPLNLVGFSGGGLLAATIAEKLRARGVKVDTIVRIGSPGGSRWSTPVPPGTRLVNIIGAADPLAYPSLTIGGNATNYLVPAVHHISTYRAYPAMTAVVQREIRR